MSTSRTVILGETEYRLTLAELSHCCRASSEQIRVLVDEGILDPVGSRHDEWRFGATDLRKARCALRLMHDLELNTAGVGLALDLLDEARRLRERIRVLEAQLRGR